MSAIQRYVGVDPNNNTSSMAQVQVTKDGFLNIATIPSDDKYVLRFWVKANTIKQCQVLQENDSLLDFQSNNSWQEKVIKFDGIGGSPILFYLPVGTYYFWHSKLEIGTLETDYSQSQQDFEDLITETTATFNSKIEQTARSITAEVTRAQNAETTAFSQIKQLADQIVLKVDSQNKLVEVELGVSAEKAESYFKVTADNINITGNEIVEIISDSNAKITANNIQISSQELVDIISSGSAKITANNISLTAQEVVNIISSGSAKIKASNIELSSDDVVSIISSGTAKIKAPNIEISAGDIGGMDEAYYKKNEVKSLIEVSENEIASTVASAQEKYDTSELAYEISFYGYGDPNIVMPYDADTWGSMSDLLVYNKKVLTYGESSSSDDEPTIADIPFATRSTPGKVKLGQTLDTDSEQKLISDPVETLKDELQNTLEILK